MAPTRLKVTADVAQEDSRDCRMPILGENLAASVGSRTTPVFSCSNPSGSLFITPTAEVLSASIEGTMSYTVKFNGGNRGWTCSVFRLGADGLVASPSVATGTGQTKDEARDGALTQTEDTAIRAALTSNIEGDPFAVVIHLPVGDRTACREAMSRPTAAARRDASSAGCGTDCCATTRYRPRHARPRGPEARR